MDAAVATEGIYFWLIPWRGRKVKITTLELCVQKSLPAGGRQALGDGYCFMEV